MVVPLSVPQLGEDVVWVPDSAFSRDPSTTSNTAQDDFNELKRATLQQIHATALGEKRAVLIKAPDGDWEIVDLTKLKHTQADKVLASALRQQGPATTDTATLLLKVKERFDAVGLRQPTVEVRFNNLQVSAQVGVGSRNLPTLSSKLLEAPRAAKAVALRTGSSRRRSLQILSGVSGVLKPGRLTLLLGPPGSGKTILLKALAGQLHDKRLKVQSDELTYNGQPLTSFCAERTAAYISQRDEHYGELTVKETLDFSARVQGSGGIGRLFDQLETLEAQMGITPDPDTAAFMRTRLATGKHNLMTSLMIRVLGLQVCQDTLVGNAMLRGISGGQRKRVTTGEMLMGPIRTAFCDEISTGLDSATTADIVRAFADYCHIIQGTMLVALLQPPPETFDLFDDVMLLASGVIVYHGPRELCLPFFQDLGFDCPPRTALADFLQDVALPGEQPRYWARQDQPFAAVSATAMAAAFSANTAAGRAIQAALLEPHPPPAADDAAAREALSDAKYGRPTPYLLRSLLRRGWILQRRTISVECIRLAQTVFTAFVVGTLFLQQSKSDLSDGQMFLGCAFFSLLYMMVGAFPDGAKLVEMLPVFYKQREARFFPGWCFALAQFVLRVPWLFVDSAIWSLMVYFLVGFVTSVRFLVFWAINFATAVFGLSLFQAVASICRVQTMASAFESFMLLVLLNTSGFVIASTNIPGGWKGAYWANPWAYWLRGLAINEFTSSDWAGPPPPNSVGASTLGESVLIARGFKTSYEWVWIGIFAWGVPTVLINLAIFAAACTFLSAPKSVPELSEEAFKEREHSRVGLNTLAPDTDDSPKALDPPPAAPADLAVVDLEKGQALATSSGSGTNGSGAVARPAGSSTLAFPPMVLTFKDLKYSVPLPKAKDSAPAPEAPTGGGNDPHAGQLLLLKGITGAFRPGVLTALMGASGAGKTTLMDCLAGRKTGGLITGDIRVNGFPKEQRAFARLSGYCEQEDVHEPLATVHEAVRFSASLRLPSDVAPAAAEAYVQEVMDLVELTPIRDSPVGLPGASGLSVEQRKRLTLAVELVANPSIIFLDEPTSGLDARAAAIVMRAVRNTVNTGRAVVCTIHQPSFSIFAAFDELLLLKRGGETIYNGPLGAGADQLIGYLEAIPGVTPIKPMTNAADWMLTVTSPDAEASSGHDFAQIFRGSALAQRAAAQAEELAAPAAGGAPPDFSSLNVAPFGRQMRALLARNFVSYSRNLSYNLTRLVISIVIGICYGTLFRAQGQATESYAGVLNIAGALYSSTLFLGITDCLMVQDIVSVNRAVYYREHAAGTYYAGAYSVAEGLVELPYLLVQAALYTIIVYWSIGFEADAGKFFWFLLAMWLSLAYWTFWGMLAVHVTPALQLANALSSMSFGVLNLFCGFLKPQPAIGSGWIWAYWINPVSYTLYSLVANQLGDVDSPLTTPDGQVTTVSGFVRSYFGFKHSFQGWTILILVAFAFFYRGCAFLALKNFNFQHR